MIVDEFFPKHIRQREDFAHAIYIKWHEEKIGAIFLSADYRKLLADNGL